MKRLSKTTRLVIIIAAVIVVIAVVIILVSSKSTSADTEAGVDYIKSREAKDTAAIENSIFLAHRDMLMAEINEDLEKDENAVWKYLNEINTVVMGDSRVVAFGNYEFLTWDKVLAEGGKTVYELPNHYEELLAANPKIVVLAYGMNDIGWKSYVPEDLASTLCGYVDVIQEMLPEAYIYVNSIIPVLPFAYADVPTYGQTREWSEYIMNYCKERGYRTLEITELVDSHQDMYWPDGIHFYPEFYPLWAKAILMQYMQDSYNEAAE